MTTDNDFSNVVSALETMPGRQDEVLIIRSSESKIKDEELLQYLVQNTEYKQYKKVSDYFGDIYHLSKP